MPRASPPDGYRPIGDYGAIGDGRSVALVGQDGAVDWWCPGGFDAPAVFGAILDTGRGGSYVVAPTAQATSSSRYLPGTNVLRTRHETTRGTIDVTDMVLGPDATGVHEAVLLRRVACVRGVTEVEADLAPRFAYGRVAPRWTPHARGLLATGAGEALLVEGAATWSRPRRGARATRVVLAEGERFDLVVRHLPFVPSDPFASPLPHTSDAMEATCVAAWRAFDARTRYEGPEAELVRRAALALKLLVHAPTGAIVAAPTTSLPEAPGGPRNWDYRYAWIRDGALCARALAALGHAEDARRFFAWADAVVARDGADGLRVLYSVRGARDLREREHPHLEGYARSRPVRTGNAAETQHQLDVYGELLDAHAKSGVGGLRPETILAVARHVQTRWRQPDAGIWEMRAAPRHFVLSKAMAWAALTRGAEAARTMALPEHAARFEEEAHQVRMDVLARGKTREGALGQAYDHPAADASNLLLPLVGFLDPYEETSRKTVLATREELATGDLLHRYRSPDGLPGGEGAFLYGSFWLVEALARQGEREEAADLFAKLARRATHLGLYAEEMDPETGAHLGNFPQGFPHAGLIMAALALGPPDR